MFGYQIKMSSKWTYYILEAKVYKYLGKGGIHDKSKV